MFSKTKCFLLFISLIFSTYSFSDLRKWMDGKTIHDLLKTQEMNVTDYGKVSVNPKIDLFFNKRGKTNCFTKTEYKHKLSGKIFFSYHTTEDICDGGNSIGWVENENHDIIYEISDSFLYVRGPSYNDIEWIVEKEEGINLEEQKRGLELLKKHIFFERSLWTSLYGYTFVNLEANGLHKELSQENIIKNMLDYLKVSTIKMIETPEGFHIGDRKLFVLKYNMEGFIPYAYFAIDLEGGQVEFIQIDD